MNSPSCPNQRSYRNTLILIQDVASRMKGTRIPLIANDGFKFYQQVIRRVFGTACLYGQVIKKRRNDRVIKVQWRGRTADFLGPQMHHDRTSLQCQVSLDYRFTISFVCLTTLNCGSTAKTSRQVLIHLCSTCGPRGSAFGNERSVICKIPSISQT